MGPDHLNKSRLYWSLPKHSFFFLLGVCIFIFTFIFTYFYTDWIIIAQLLSMSSFTVKHLQASSFTLLPLSHVVQYFFPPHPTIFLHTPV